MRLLSIQGLTPDEVNLIGGALGKMPYETVATLIGKIKSQIHAQEAATMTKEGN